MAYVTIPTCWMPRLDLANYFYVNNAVVIDATGEKIAFIGRVKWAGGATSKALRRVGFRLGTVTKAGGSALTVSLQDVSLTAGPTYQPDGTPDQTVAIANGDAAFASNTWYRTGTFSADRTVTHGELLAVVIEYDGSGRLGSDAVNISASNGGTLLTSGVALYTSSWPSTSSGYLPSIILEADDGTFGTMVYGHPTDGVSANESYASNSTPDERALQFSVQFKCKIDSVWFAVATASGANFDVVLYSGTTAIVTVSIDQNSVAQNNSIRILTIPITETELTPGTTYYLSIKPTTTTSVTIVAISVNDANHWSVHEGGTAFCYASRTDAGAWSSTTTKRPYAGIGISALENGAQTISPTFALGV